MEGAIQKTIDVFVVDLEQSGTTPAIARADENPNCEGTRAFYEAMRSRGLQAEVTDYTIIHYDRPSGDSVITVRNACCVGDTCSVKLEPPIESFCGPQVDDVVRMLEKQGAKGDRYMLVVETAVLNEKAVECVIENLEGRGYVLHTWEG